MVLAAKDDRMPDCVTRPEPVWADAPEAEETAEEETEETAEEPFFVPDSSFQQGEQGTLINVEEYGPAVQPEENPEEPAEKPKKVKKEKARKEAGPEKPKMRWFKGKIKDIGVKVKNGVLDFYDEMTREEEENENK